MDVTTGLDSMDSFTLQYSAYIYYIRISSSALCSSAKERWVKFRHQGRLDTFFYINTNWLRVVVKIEQFGFVSYCGYKELHAAHCFYNKH